MGALADGLLAYAKPLLDQTDGSEEQVSRAFALSQVCYNLALLPADSRDEAISELQPTLDMDDEEFDEFRRDLIIPMIERHQVMFPLMHRSNSSSLPQSAGLSMQTSPRGTARVETYPGTDRYAPCRCHSGEKYKFCCGAKRR